MGSPAAREIIALYEHVAAVFATSAALADEEARKSEVAGNLTRASVERSRADHARRAADRGRRGARRLFLGAQADRLFGHLPRWGAVFDGDETPDGVLLRDFDQAIIGTDMAGTIKLWNRAAERLYGWRRAEVVGCPITEITVGPEDAEVAERIMASVRCTGRWEGEFWVTRHDGTRFLAYVRDVTVSDDDGWPIGLVGVSLDLAPGLADPTAVRSAPS